MFERRPVRAGFERTPYGVIRVNVPLRGRMSWRALNGDGTPALVDVLDHHGQPSRQAHEMAWRPNLITNAGLDFLCATRSTAGFQHATARGTLAVGTGSTEPAATDTALDAEAQSGTTAGTGALSSLTYSSGVITVRERVSRQITLNANRNLTEYGFREGTSNLFVRELFRDELGDPITLSMLSGKIIQVRHELVWELADAGISSSLDIQEIDALNVVTGTTSYSLELGWMRNTATANAQGLLRLAEPGGLRTEGTQQGIWAFRKTAAYTLPDPFTATSGTGTLANSEGQTSIPWNVDAYTTGSFKRVRRGTVAVAQLNGIYYGLAWGIPGASSAGTPVTPTGLAIRFVSPTTFTKLDTHTFALALEVAVARA